MRKRIIPLLLAFGLMFNPIVTHAIEKQIDINVSDRSIVDVGRGTKLHIPAPTGYDSSIMEFYGIRVSRYFSDTKGDKESQNLGDYIHPVIVNGKEYKDYTVRDNGGSNFTLDFNNSEFNVFSGFWNFNNGKDTALINGRTTFRIKVDYLFKLTDGSGIIINGYHQDFLERLVTQPPVDADVKVTKEDGTTIINNNDFKLFLYNDKRNFPNWINRPVYITCDKHDDDYQPIRRTRYWLFKRGVGDTNNFYVNMRDNKKDDADILKDKLKDIVLDWKKGYMKNKVTIDQRDTQYIFNKIGDSFISNEKDKNDVIRDKIAEMDKGGYYVVVACGEDYVGNFTNLTYTTISYDDRGPKIKDTVFYPLTEKDNYIRGYVHAEDDFSGVKKIRYKTWRPSGNSEPNYKQDDWQEYIPNTQPFTDAEINAMDTKHKESLMEFKEYYGLRIKKELTGVADIHLKIQCQDNSGNWGDEREIVLQRNKNPEIHIENIDKDIRVGGNSFIVFNGKVRDKDQNQMLTVGCEFLDKGALLPGKQPNDLMILSNGKWQDYSYLFSTNDLAEGKYESGVKFTVEDTCGDKVVDKYKGTIIVDKTAPNLVSDSRLTDVSTDPNYSLYKFIVADNLSGLNYIDSKFANKDYKFLPYPGNFSGSDITVFYQQTQPDNLEYEYYLYVPKAKKIEQDSILTFVAKDAVDNSVNFSFTFSDGGMDYSDDKDFGLGTGIDMYMDMLNYDERVPKENIRKVKAGGEKGLIHTLVFPCRGVQHRLQVYSDKYATLQCDINKDGKNIYKGVLKDVKTMNCHVDLKADVQNNKWSQYDVVLRDTIGNIVRHDKFAITIQDDFPVYWDYTNKTLATKTLQGLPAEYPNVDTSKGDYYIGNNLSSALKSYEKKFSKIGTSVCATEGDKFEKKINKIAVISSFNNTDGSKSDFSINTVNTKPKTEISIVDGRVMQTISLFGYNFTSDSVFLKNFCENSEMYLLKKVDDNAKLFLEKDVEVAYNKIKDEVNHIHKADTFSYDLTDTGEYQVVSNMNFYGTNLKGLGNVSFISKGDMSTLIPCNMSDRFMYNDTVLPDGDTIVYDNSTKKTIIVQLGSNVKSICYNDKVYVYNSKGYRVYSTKDLSLISSNDSLAVADIDVYGGKVYLATSKGLYREDNLKKPVVNTPCKFMRVLNDNMMLGTGNQVINLNLEDVNNSPKKDVGKELKGVYLDVDQNVVLVYVDGTSELFMQR